MRLERAFKETSQRCLRKYSELTSRSLKDHTKSEVFVRSLTYFFGHFTDECNTAKT